MLRRYPGWSFRLLTSPRTVKIDVMSALELLRPAAQERSLANAISAPRRLPGKFCATRRATALGYTVQSPAAGDPSGTKDNCRTTPDFVASTIRMIGSLRGEATTQKPRSTAQTRLGPPA